MLWVGQDGGEGDPAGIVDGDVEIFSTCAAALARAVAVDAVVRLDDAGQTLDLEVDQIAGMYARSVRPWWQIERSQPVHAGPAQDTLTVPRLNST